MFHTKGYFRFFITFTTLLHAKSIYACDFTDPVVVKLLENIFDSSMYNKTRALEDTNDTLKMENQKIGNWISLLLGKPKGRILLEKLAEFSSSKGYKLKINIIANSFLIGLQRKPSEGVWHLQMMDVSVPRMVWVKLPEGSFCFGVVNIPPYIVLAHELLHYLLRLESPTPETFLTNFEIKDFPSEIIPVFGDGKTKKKQAYDEFSVIVGYKYGKDFLSESVLLQEFLGTTNCFLCYGHSLKLSSLLTQKLVNQVIGLPSLEGLIATECATEEDLIKIKNPPLEKKSGSTSADSAHIRITREELPRRTEPSSLLANILQTHELHNVLGDGNCGIYAILQGANPLNLPHEIVQGLDYNFSIPEGSSREDMPQWQNAKKLREFLFSEGDPRREMATGLSDPNLQIRELQNFDLSYIAQSLGQDILFFSDDVKMAVLYHANGNIDIIEKSEDLPSDVSTCICLYHSGNHFQAIVPKGK